MPIPEIIKILLIVDLAAMALLACFYLRRRRLSPLARAAWALVALCLPVIGPFLVILARPGRKAGSASDTLPLRISHPPAKNRSQTLTTR